MWALAYSKYSEYLLILPDSLFRVEIILRGEIIIRKPLGKALKTIIQKFKLQVSCSEF